MVIDRSILLLGLVAVPEADHQALQLVEVVGVPPGTMSSRSSRKIDWYFCVATFVIARIFYNIFPPYGPLG